jgi:adenosine deaminase
LGHAVTAVQDPTLVAYLVDKQIPLELCPQSNVQIGAVPSLAAHPFGTYYRSGARVTINSDDPAIFGNPLNDEYLAVVRAFDLSPHDLCQLILAAVEASFLPAADRALLKQEMAREIDAALATIGWPPRPDRVVG